jgi:hypothetical protein
MVAPLKKPGRNQAMAGIKWTIKGREFVHCNCAYGCPCQFNARPTHGKCHAVLAFQIDEGHHGTIRLNGLRFAGIVAWPGPIHERHGQMVPIVDERGTQEQRQALLRILGGQDTDPGATIFQVFSTTYDKVHEPIFATIEFELDIEARRARLRVPGLIDARGEPILNPVTGKEHRGRINLPHGFEYDVAEVGRGWATTKGALALDIPDSHAQFAKIHMTQSGVVH